MFKNFGRLLVCLFFVLILFASSAVAELMVATTDVYLRDVPQGEKIALIRKGTELEVLATKKLHIKVKYNGKEGWVYKPYLEKCGEQIELEERIPALTKYKVNLKPTPNTNARNIAYLKNGTKLNVISDDKKWAKVICENGQRGYVPINSLKKVKKYLVVEVDRVVCYNIKKEQVGSFKKGKKLEVIETRGGWAKVKYNGKEVYVSFEGCSLK